MSLRKAINQMCKSCIHDPLSPGSWRQHVFLCSAKSCPLWDITELKPTSRCTSLDFTLVWGRFGLNLRLPDGGLAHA